jgi:hypothetical protein
LYVTAERAAELDDPGRHAAWRHARSPENNKIH